MARRVGAGVGPGKGRCGRSRGVRSRRGARTWCVDDEQVKGKFYATGHLCTHYNMPLAKGTLTEDGRITCPYHGACFQASSGDIEDAPGVDGEPAAPVRRRARATAQLTRAHAHTPGDGTERAPALTSFDVKVENGRVLVTAEEKQLASSTARPPSPAR